MSSGGRPNATCEICSSPFYRKPSPDRNGLYRRACSRSCGLELRKQLNALRYLDGKSCDVGYASCAICQSLLPRNYAKPQACAKKECAAERQRWQHHRKRGQEVPPRASATRACDECGQRFQPTRATQRYCSSRCGGKAGRRTRKHRQRVALRLADRVGTTDHRQHRDGTCAECGKALTGRQKRWCSAQCAEISRSRHRDHVARQAFKGIAPLAAEVPFTTREIAERDGWRCHICSRQVKPCDASLDHLIPISDGGVHKKANVRLAHHRCNSIRSDTGHAQLLLIA